MPTLSRIYASPGLEAPQPADALGVVGERKEKTTGELRLVRQDSTPKIDAVPHKLSAY